MIGSLRRGLRRKIHSYVATIPWESARQDGANLPNCISYVRIATAWLPAYLLVIGFHVESLRWWAVATFIVIALSDVIDGWIARHFNMQSDWGAFIDPLADKILVIGTGIALCIMYAPTGHAWTLYVSIGIFLARELVIAAQIKSAQHKVVPPTAWGKAKTFFQVAMLAAWASPFMLIGHTELRAVVAVSTCAALIVTFISWSDYHKVYVAEKSKGV